MELIDKSALVAEIESKIEKYTKRGEESDAKCDGYGMYWGGVISCLNEVHSFLDTFEVKEVDLDRAIDKWIDDAAITHEDCSVTDVISTAKHFFELGLKTQKGD